jgi:adenine-specific DNA methylase
MVEAKGYWLSIQTNNNLHTSQQRIDNSQLKYIVKIHNGDSPVTAIAHSYSEAIHEFKEKLRELKAREPLKMPTIEDFEDKIENEKDDIAMVFLSEFDLDLRS